MGRQALVTISFDVDEAGRPVRVRAASAGEPVWGNEAISIVSVWRFVPGSENGKAVSVPCTVDLVWTEKPWN